MLGEGDYNQIHSEIKDRNGSRPKLLKLLTF